MARIFGIQNMILFFISERFICLYYISKIDFIEEPIFMKNKNSDREVVAFIYNLLGTWVAHSSQTNGLTPIINCDGGEGGIRTLNSYF
jgi:hypothetical protein